MPHFWNNILVVTVEELVPSFWSSYAVLKVEINRYKNKQYGIKRVQRGGNGRQALISFDSLLKEYQESIGDPRKLNHPLEAFYEIDPNAVSFYGEFQRPNYGYLKPDETEKYIINASMVSAIIKLEQARIQERLSKGGSIRATANTRSVIDTLVCDAITFQDVLKAKYNTQHNLPQHPRRFRETLSNFQSNGYVSLVKDPQGKSLKNAKKVTDETVDLLNSMFATQAHKPTPTEVSAQYDSFLTGYLEIINNQTGELYAPSNFRKLSASTVKSYINQWENQIATHSKRSGNRQNFMTKFIPYDRMEQPSFAGSIISIDDRQPPFKYPDGKSGKRMWYYIAIDLASQAITCWVSGTTKEGLILNFYRQLVRNYHQWGVQLPDGLECESSLNASFKDTFLTPGAMFQNVRIEANNARGKRIEAYFRQLRYKVEKERVGWIARPTALSEANQMAEDKIPMLPQSEIMNNVLEDIVMWNNMAHNKNQNESRWDYFMNNQNPDLKPTNYKAILPHLGFETNTSCRAGIMNLQYGEYLLGENGDIASGEKLINLMKKVEGKEITIYWIDDNQGDIIKAHIYKDDRFICEALPIPFSARAKIEETDAHREARSIMARYKKTVTQYLQNKKNAIDKVTIIDNRPKVIGTSFSIEGIGAYQPREKEAEVLDTNQDEAIAYKPRESSYRVPLQDRI